MSEIVKQRICMMVTNTVKIAIFAVLAIVFNHWWIVFVSCLFVNHEKKEYDSKLLEADYEQGKKM